MTTTNETFSNKIANVNGDISSINKRLFQCNIEHDHLDNLIKEEKKQRQIVENKTYLMNETFMEQISLLKSGLNSLSLTMQENVEEIKSKIFKDVKKNNNKFIQSIESNFIKSNEFNNYQPKSGEVNLDQKLSVLEDIIGCQLNEISNELKTNKEMNTLLSQKIEANTQMLNESIKGMNKELNVLKNEIEMIKGFRLTTLETFGKISDDMIYSNEQIRKCSNDVSLYIQSAESKMKHFENVFIRFNESFIEMKSSISTQIEAMNKNYSSKNERMVEELMTKLKESKNEMEQRNMNIIKENQKFIEYNNSQFQSFNSNMKKLFDYSNDDIEILKKKSEGLDGIIKTLRFELLNHIDQLELSFHQRFNSMPFPLNKS